MSNANNPQSHEREVRQEFYNDATGNTYTNVTRTSEAVNNDTTGQKTNSYRDGYMHGRVSERRYQENVLTERDNDNAARGLLVGILVTSLIGLTVGAVWLVNQSNQEATQVTPPVLVPNSQPEANQPPEKETIIEKTREVLVPLPQEQSPPAPQPDINISVPNTAPQQPEAKQAPVTETTPSQPQTQSSNADSPTAQSNADTTTPTQEPANQTDVTSDSNPVQ